MIPLLALALLLAGCATAPKPTPESMPLGNASQEAKITLGPEYTQEAVDLTLDAVRKHVADDAELVTAMKLLAHEIAALKRRVAELEKRCPPAAYGPSGAVFQEEPK